jgi:hypothetical protein
MNSPTHNASNENHLKPWISIVLGVVALLVFACTTSTPDNETDPSTNTEEDQQTIVSEGQSTTNEEDLPTTIDATETDSPVVRILEENVDGGPALTKDNPNEAGIHLRQFHAWNDPEQARSDLATLVFTDGGDRSAWADVLAMEGGTLVALLPGIQRSSGIVNTDIKSITTDNEQLTLTVRTTVAGRCSADDSLATPFRIAHVSAAAPDVLFREAIIPCTEATDEMGSTSISGISVHFPDDATAHIDWNPPTNTDNQIRYNVVESANQADILESVIQPGHTIHDLVPGVIYTRRIEPVNNDGDALAAGTSIALMVDAPSGVFRGRAVREDLEKLKSQLAGDNPTDCGEFANPGDFIIPDENINTASEVSDCVVQALDNGVAFTADRTFIGEAYSYSSLVGDNMGNRWLLKQGNSDVVLENDFVPSAPVYGGYLTGQTCETPAVNVNTEEFTC